MMKQFLAISLIILPITFSAQRLSGEYLYRFYGGRIRLQISSDSTFKGRLIQNADTVDFSGKLFKKGNDLMIADRMGDIYIDQTVFRDDKELIIGTNKFYKVTIFRRIFKNKIPVKYPDF